MKNLMFTLLTAFAVSGCAQWAQDLDTDTDAVTDGDTDIVGKPDVVQCVEDLDGDFFPGIHVEEFEGLNCPDGYMRFRADSEVGTDCNDKNPAVNPVAVETCNNIDDNCNGQVDDGAIDAKPYYTDADGDGYGMGAVEYLCFPQGGYAANAGDCNDTDPAVNSGVIERCGNGVDDDCNAATTDTCPNNFVDFDGDGVGESQDCNDQNANVYPGAFEICGNGVDENCDGSDESCPVDVIYVCYVDSDADGYGNPSISQEFSVPCQGAWVVDNTDCSDTEPRSFPGNLEIEDGIDNNCDGDVDEGFSGQVDPTVTCWNDADGDGYGAHGSEAEFDESVGCVGDWVAQNNDCDDSDAGANPLADEVCDGVDNDCNAVVDEGCPVGTDVTCYSDADNDGFGDPNDTMSQTDSCSGGYVEIAGDCNDDPVFGDWYNPDQEETCGDTQDYNCDGYDDPLAGCVECYWDSDGDGYGSSNLYEMEECDGNYVAIDGDCEIFDADSYPGAYEDCDGIDNDCDGDVDEGCVSTPTDSDGDGDPDSTDCADYDATVYNGAYEYADLVDNDCDGYVDEGAPLTYLSRWFCDWDNGIGDWEHGFGSLPDTSSCQFDGRYIELYPTSVGGELDAIVQCSGTLSGAGHDWNVTFVETAGHPDLYRSGFSCTTLGYGSKDARTGWEALYRHASYPFTNHGYTSVGHGDVMWSTSPWEASSECDSSFSGRDDEYSEHGDDHQDAPPSCTGAPAASWYAPFAN